MQKTTAIRLLIRNGATVINLLERVEPSFSDWKPSPDTWSALEVACHLLDEERDDFRTRIRLTLEDPRQEWPRIDPETWVTERDYASRNIEEVVADLRRERAASIAWLESTEIDLTAAHEHPQLGIMRTGDLLASWAAHDLLHLRQITRLQFQWLEREASPYSIRYAGSW